MTIRKAKSTDWKSVVEIYKREELPDEVRLVTKDLPKEFAEIKTGQRIIWLAEHKGKTIGTIQLVLENREKADLANGKDVAMIHHLRVEKKHADKGVASALFQELEKEALQKNIHMLTLEVETSNGRAREIYEHWDFEYGKQGRDPKEVVMFKEIGQEGGTPTQIEKDLSIAFAMLCLVFLLVIVIVINNIETVLWFFVFFR